MKKVYFLQTCDTCRRILNEVNIDGFEQQEIKSNPLNAQQLDALYAFTNSYEALFNKRARLYKSLDLKNKALTEDDYKRYLLENYTFLKRPVFVVNDQIFVGNSKKEIAALKDVL